MRKAGLAAFALAAVTGLGGCGAAMAEDIRQAAMVFTYTSFGFAVFCALNFMFNPQPERKLMSGVVGAFSTFVSLFLLVLLVA